MKKTYCKPQIAFEDFELCANIANTCGISAGPSDVQQCGFYLPGFGKIFFRDYNICDRKVWVDGQYSCCYHIPQENLRLFNS